MYHVFFTHSSVDGYLGSYHVLAVVNGAAINIGVHASYRFVRLSGIINILCNSSEDFLISKVSVGTKDKKDLQ